MLTLWGRRSAFNVQKVLWLIGELGLPHQWIDAGGDAGGLDSPAFLAMNPHGLVPVLKDGEVVVWESHAVLRYLAACYGGPDWWPESPAIRSLADGWMDWSQTALQPAFMGLFWSWFRTPEPERNSGRIAGRQAACERHYGLLDRILERQPYLGGQRLTLADLPAGTTLYRYFEMGITVPRPRQVEAWYARLAERPAYREHVMRPFGELLGRREY